MNFMINRRIIHYYIFLLRLVILFVQGHQEKNRSQRQGCFDSRGYDN